MGILITDGAAFLTLFSEFEHVAYRLEARTAYGVPEENELFRSFPAGHGSGEERLGSWLELMVLRSG
ncbi:DUF6879 family protein [Streptosporangium sp. NPDC087985]|uniref:DUF6879 family protein n=1 Tax=Streptosporangium sp. NPDC087985 TaxID=3366196 RepID=UPI0038236F6B